MQLCPSEYLVVSIKACVLKALSFLLAADKMPKKNQLSSPSPSPQPRQSPTDLGPAPSRDYERRGKGEVGGDAQAAVRQRGKEWFYLCWGKTKRILIRNRKAAVS